MFCHHVTELQYGAVNKHENFTEMTMLVTTETGSIEVNLFANCAGHAKLIRRFALDLELEALATWCSAPYADISISIHNIESATVEWCDDGVKIDFETSDGPQMIRLFTTENQH